MDTQNHALLTYQQKFCSSLEEVSRRVEELRSQGATAVLTSGTFDILHVGHGRYLSLARSLGGFLVVGIDSDAKVHARKGPHRPVVNETERAEMVAFLGAVDLLYVKQLEDPHWALIKAVRPDILVISKRSEYSEQEIEQLGQYCGCVHVLASQAETSTTARIRMLLISSVGPLISGLDELEERVIAMKRHLAEITGGKP